MFHLQDFLEKLELLPSETKDKLSKIGDMDSLVEQYMGIVKKNFDDLFSKADHLNPDELLHKFNQIMKTGEKAIELSDNKIQVANNLKKLLQKYMKILDVDLLKFQENLDEKYGDIAADIEKRVIDSEESPTTLLKKNKYHLNKYVFGDQVDYQPYNSESDEEIDIGDSGPECLQIDSPLQGYLPQEEINSEKQSSSTRPSDISTNNEIVVKSDEMKKSKTKKKKKEKKAQGTTLVNEKQNEVIKRYCVCNEVAYDTMIACDNKSCPYEWFHFECVGISEQPQGKWYCTACLKKMKKKSRR